MRILREGDFLYEESLYPQVAYAFKHPLTHEVAYRTQLKDRRAQTHASVARIIEALGGDRLDEVAALIAHHWEEAGERAIAARWHARAARWIGIRDYAEAFAHWRRATDLIGDDGAPDDLALRAEAFCMLPVLAYRTETSDEEEAAFFEQGRRFLERISDERSLAAFTVAYAGLRENACDLRGYEQVTREACRIAERCGELALRAAVRPDRLWSLYRLGQLRESLAVTDEIAVITGGDVELGADICGYSPHFMSHLMASVVLSELGRFPEARVRAERAVQIALARGPDESLCWAHVVHVLVLDGVGACGPVVAHIARLALEAAERSGSPQALVCAQSAVLAAGKCNGDWSAAMTAAEAALRVSRAQRVARDFEFKILGDYAEALLGAGKVERAVEVATEAIELAESRGALVHRCHALVVLARCLREQRGIGVADQLSGLLDEVDRLVEETGAAYWRPRALVERAELDRLRGDTESARRTLTMAQRLFAEMGATGYAERIAKELAQ
jgi:tetratricopeptide (TPR) repeat protein